MNKLLLFKEHVFVRTCVVLCALTMLVITSCEDDGSTGPVNTKTSFTIAVIPDAQNMTDFKHQKSKGFALDCSELFIQQMQYIADHSESKGGDIVFAISVGDLWQHQTLDMDPEHAARGFKAISNPYFSTEIEVSPEGVYNVELPIAKKGLDILHQASVPFGGVPGNHDYDAMWSDSKWIPVSDPSQILGNLPEYIGMLHIGGLSNFNALLGCDTKYFAQKDWYLDSYNGGANSVQMIRAGGYTFIHLGLEMSPSNDVLAWAQSVLDKYKDYPTILTTHDYLDTKGQRKANPIVDLKLADSDHHNNAEELWSKFISKNAQIFLVLCGHEHGQNRRMDKNDKGGEVYQILADYQERGEVGVEHGQPLNPYFNTPYGIGDGWLRKLEFEMGSDVPTLHVRTYSTYYKKFSTEIADYAARYKSIEHKGENISDAEFVAMDDFVIELKDFRTRFGLPK